MTTTTTRKLTENFGVLDCQIAQLLSGCYGHHGYMQDQYGITAERCARLVVDVAETAEEHGVTTREVWAALKDAADRIDSRWDREHWG